MMQRDDGRAPRPPAAHDKAADDLMSHHRVRDDISPRMAKPQALRELHHHRVIACFHQLSAGAACAHCSLKYSRGIIFAHDVHGHGDNGHAHIFSLPLSSLTLLGHLAHWCRLSRPLRPIHDPRRHSKT